MEFAIVEEISPEILKHMSVFSSMSAYLSDKFSKKDYGNGVGKIIAGLNCVNPGKSNSIEHFETGYVIYKKYTGTLKLLDFTVRLNYNETRKASRSQIVDIISKALLNSYHEIKKLEIKQFEIDKFYGDLKELVGDRSWLNKSGKREIFNYQQTQGDLTIPSHYKRMNLDDFWVLIERAKIDSNNDFIEQIRLITNRLSAMEEADIVGFEFTLRELLLRANDYNVMAIQKIIEKGVSDDGFLYFRCKLILCGKIIFENAINNPDNILGLTGENAASVELLLNVSNSAFKMKFGEATEKTLPRDTVAEMIDYDFTHHPLHGKPWTDDDLPKRYSKLWKLYR